MIAISIWVPSALNVYPLLSVRAGRELSWALMRPQHCNTELDTEEALGECFLTELEKKTRRNFKQG